MARSDSCDLVAQAVRYALGGTAFLAGADKFTNLLANWEMYLNPLAPKLLHIKPTTFMHIVGVVEIAVGILVLSRFTRYAAYIVMIWLVCIALNLVSQGMFFDIAVRDVELALAAFALARLTEVRQQALVKSSEPLTIRDSKTHAIA